MADQDVVGQHGDGIERLVGHQIRTRRMMQIQAAEHFAKALFLGAFEPVPLEERLGHGFVARLAHHIGVTPPQISLPLPPRHGKGSDLLALSRLMLDPSILLLRLAGERWGTPLVLGQIGRQTVQLIGPFVATDAPLRKTCLLDPIQVLARAGTAVRAKRGRLPRPTVLVLLQQDRQVPF